MGDGKKFVNPFFVALPILALITILVMCGTYFILEQDTHHVQKEFLDTAEHDILWNVTEAKDDQTDTYYQLFIAEKQGEYIAFQMSEGELDKIEGCAGSYYPESYWQGECSDRDLTALFQYEISEGVIYEKELEHVKVYDISAYKGYESYLGNGGTILLLFLCFCEAGVSIVLFVVLLVIGIVIQVKHRNSRRYVDGTTHSI
ncbi:MAG: hypothetical protein Q4G60_06195 [bacterium]|nr:hypothetical protein [bacterium]